MDKYSYLGNGDVATFENLYSQYKKDNNSVDVSWQKFFEGFELARTHFGEQAEVPETFAKEFKVINLINAYRSRGHLFTKTNPVRERRKYSPALDIENFGLSETDLDTVFQAGSEVGIGPLTLRQIIEHLTQVYCQSIGVEYMYIRKPEEVDWIKQQLHVNSNTPSYTIEQKKHILNKLNEAVVFENFLHTKFVGQKRFSLEGLEALIPALDAVVEHGAEQGAEEYVFGMAHRGRLNVLANIFRKTYQQIFTEFEGKEYEDSLFEGDVKYHLGFSGNTVTSSGKTVHMSMTANPSHLEAVDPVVEGIARAKLDNKYGNDTNKLIPILIHGDASIAGQGIVYEIVQMAGLEGYHTGGTIHIVTNNQVGFTTNYIDGRTSTYCTDVGKVTLCPVFHVNADDVEAVVHAVQMAVRYRQRFHKDVFIDLLGYRKYGHNEGDEPRFTQPLLYKAIAKHPNIREIYIKKLAESGVIEADLAKKMEKEFKALLDTRLNEAKEATKNKVATTLEASWEGIRQSKKGDFDKSPETGVSKKKLIEIGEKISTIPKGKKFFKKIEKVLEDRAAMIKNNSVDWGLAEHLAFGSLLTEGHTVRFSGQDVERGTFSHRHAVLKIEDSEEEYIPLNNLSEKQQKLLIYNSLLSEFGVLGFEYGYSLASPNSLTIWEAQFGDFANGAQTIIDQFISCGEDKWKRLNNLVMLLPHGYEGQGAEHSSGRPERYLQLCGEANMQIVNCTTPANYFHVLRRQIYWPFRKPLVVFSPKKLLRYPKCVSTLDEMAKGSFQEVLDDTIDAKSVDTIALCSGKIYYEMIEEREKCGADNIAFIRLEQLYPFPAVQLEKILAKYKNVKKWLWVQEEPSNQGAWPHILRYYRHMPLQLISRPGSGTTATGSHSKHDKQHEEILNKVFAKQLVKN
jgi:2-oxoglutarate dehydrogenase E1 component